MTRSRRLLLILALALLAVLALRLIGPGTETPLPALASPTAAEQSSTDVPAPLREAAPLAIPTAVWPRVRVVDATSGAGLVGAALAVRNKDAQSGPWLTDSSGEATLRDWPGPCELGVRAEGYFPGSLELDAPVGEAPTETRSVTLHSQGRLELRAVDDAGSPTADVQFQVRPRDELTAVADLLPWPVYAPMTMRGIPTPSNTTGEPVVIEPLPCGVPLVVQWHQGGLGGESEITIPPAERRAELKVVISGVAEVIGRFVNEAGAPIARRTLEIMVSPRRGASAPICATQPDGRFRFIGVPTGPAVLVMTNTPNRYGFDVVAPLTDLGDLVAREPVRISGIIVDGSLPPQPSKSYTVEALSPGHHVVRNSSDKDSTFSMLVPPGPITLLVRAGRTGWWDDPGILGELHATAPAEDLRIDLHKPSGQLRGRLPPEIDCERVQVVLYRDRPSGERGVSLLFNSNAYEGVPVEGGEFLLGPLTPDRYDVLVRCGADGNAWVVDTRVDAGSVTDLGLLAVGRAKLTCKQPVPAEHPGIVARPLDPFGKPKSAEAGKILTLDAGPWLLFPAEVVTGRAHGRLLDAFAGQRSTWSPDDWDAAGSIVGTALEGETPVVDAEVSLRPAVETDALGPSSVLATRHTDAQGRFTFEHVLPGSYRLSVRPRPSAGPTTRTVTVSADAQLDIVLEMTDAVAQVRFLSDSEPLLDVTMVELSWMADGDLHRWVQFQQGEWLEVPCVGAPAWLCLTRGPNAQDERTWGASHAVRLDALAPGSQVVVRLPDNAVLVDFAPDAVGVPEPDVLLSHAGGAVTDVQWRPRQADDGRLRYGGLPAGATLRLTGRDREGAFLEREIVVPVGQRSITWP
ncbi:MAG: carboxypeptidase regulatory-like domain-containing protein [Planctomycetes bacterium]|nr:carboxypeptidase regulatory-like domain-containing protein [Planctomycetota bacterium]